MFNKLIEFPDGTFGVRAYWFFGWRYRDLTMSGFAWAAGSPWFQDCKGTEERAKQFLSHI